MKNYLLLTLGHNSSAMFIDGVTEKVIAYEQERFDGIKASSQFPRDAINEIIKHIGFKPLGNCAIRISHWFNINDYDQYENKYIGKRDMQFLRSFTVDIKFVNKRFTHHDAHAYSALAFLHQYVNDDDATERTVIVADGFGNNGEVLSVYKYTNDEFSNLKKVHTVYGYEASLGLMYQFATGFCGMKENQDEYKLLGYEAEIGNECDADKIKTLDAVISVKSKYLTSRILNQIQLRYENEHTVINYEYLHRARENWNALFDEITSDSKSIYYKRVVVAYVTQSILEKVMLNVLKAYKVVDAVVTGGVFYNVKLNNTILKNISGTLCIMPIAGDQGAAVGMYYRETLSAVKFGDMCLGPRELYALDANRVQHLPRAFVADESYIKSIARIIAEGGIVNIIHGNMEFGPRALCNTSTLFLPTKLNVAKNNHNNKRNEIMPCAPVLLEYNANKYFNADDLERVIGSDEFMICTHDYTDESGMLVLGAAHSKPLSNIKTGRPQIVRDSKTFIGKLLEELWISHDVDLVVNTSFNAHGNPIVFETSDILRNYTFQLERCEKGDEPYLFIIK